MKGTLNYKEYSCPCGGRAFRKKIDLVNKGFFKSKMIFTYYYECWDCDIVSGEYEADITDKCK